jgi:hypothetical protein
MGVNEPRYRKMVPRIDTRIGDKIGRSFTHRNDVGTLDIDTSGHDRIDIACRYDNQSMFYRKSHGTSSHARSAPMYHDHL